MVVSGINGEMTDVTGLLNCVRMVRRHEAIATKFFTKLKLRNQIAEPDSRRSCLSLACLGGVDTLKADAVLDVVFKDGHAVAVGDFDDFPGEGVGSG